MSTRTRVAAGALAAVSATFTLLSAQDCADAYTLPAGPYAQDQGIAAYRIYEGQNIGGEVVDIVDLLDRGGQFVGQVMGGVLKADTDLEDYVFTATDLVGEPPLQTLTGGDSMFMYIEETYVGELSTKGVTGPMTVVDDEGLAAASKSIRVQAAVLSDAAVRAALADSVASTPYNNPGEFDAARGPAVRSTGSDDDDCPFWVVTTACGTCAACIWVGEAPPPCWGACITCGACLGIAIPKPKPGPKPPKPKPRPYPKPCVTFAGGTLVHTPKGLVPIETLEVGDEVLSLTPEGAPIVTRVTLTELHEDHVESVIFVGEDAIRSTRGHMMMGPKGWIPAEKIGLGKVLGIGGEFVEVDSVEACQLGADEGVDVVCHILVESGTGYFVGTTGLFAEAH